MKFIQTSLLFLFKISLIIFIQLSAHSKTLVAVDIDDTLKVSHIKKWTDALKNMNKTENLFQGSNILLNALMDNIDDIQIAYVTNAKSSLMGRSHRKFIEQNQFPEGEIYFWSGDGHKVRTIQRLIENYQPTNVILIGDNGEEDSKFYNEIAHHSENANINFFQFLHIIYNGKSIFNDQIGYVTSLEIAMELKLAGFLQNESSENLDLTEELASLILNDLPPSKTEGPMIFPKWINCSQFSWQPQWDFYSDISTKVLSAKNELSKVCSN